MALALQIVYMEDADRKERGLVLHGWVHRRERKKSTYRLDLENGLDDEDVVGLGAAGEFAAWGGLGAGVTEANVFLKAPIVAAPAVDALAFIPFVFTLGRSVGRPDLEADATGGEQL